MKSKVSKIALGASSLLVLPMLVSAQVTIQSGFGGFIFQIIDFVKRVLDTIFPMITIVLVILFAWQLIRFLSNKDDVEKSDVMKKRLGNAFIALFIWFVLFGLINVLGNAFGLNPGATQKGVPVIKV